MVRVLMVVGQFWPTVGGAENQARRLAIELQRQGAGVEVWTGRWDAAWRDDEVVDGVRVRRMGTPWPRWPRRVRRWIFTSALLPALVRSARSFDVIHVHQVLYPAFVAALAGGIRGVPCVARIASTGSTSDLDVAARGGLGFQRAVTRRLLTRIVAVNARAEAECRAFGYRPEQVVRIPNGVEVAATPPAKPQRAGLSVVYVGGLRAEKRVDDIVAAWIAAATPGRLTIVGEGSERSRLEALAARAGGTVELRGELPDPAALLADADVFVLASSAEGMSNALLEAMAAGCACVATFVGGNVDLLGPELTSAPPAGAYAAASAGLLVGIGDVEALACALRDLGRDAPRRRALGTSAHRRCREAHSMAAVARAYLELYRSFRGAR
jgi:glycosyltransferase involved in cell wall biosynthesis